MGSIIVIIIILCGHILAAKMHAIMSQCVTCVHVWAHPTLSFSLSLPHSLSETHKYTHNRSTIHKLTGLRRNMSACHSVARVYMYVRIWLFPFLSLSVCFWTDKFSLNTTHKLTGLHGNKNWKKTRRNSTRPFSKLRVAPRRFWPCESSNCNRDVFTWQRDSACKRFFPYILSLRSFAACLNISFLIHALYSNTWCHLFQHIKRGPMLGTYSDRGF